MKRKQTKQRKEQILRAQAKGWTVPRKVVHGAYHAKGNAVVYEYDWYSAANKTTLKQLEESIWGDAGGRDE